MTSAAGLRPGFLFTDHWHYAASFGIGLSTNRKKRVLRVRDLNLWPQRPCRTWASDAY